MKSPFNRKSKHTFLYFDSCPVATVKKVTDAHYSNILLSSSNDDVIRDLQSGPGTGTGTNTFSA